jgi:rubredoxin
MAYDRKIYEKTNCPRCSYSKAELRLDVVKPTNDRYLVYFVCPICKLSQYRFSTTKKAVKLQSRIEKLQRALMDLDPKSNRARSVRANIGVLLSRRRKYEIGA